MMRNPKALPDEDLERLSAYLDGQLPKDEASRLESRLETEEDLRKALDELRQTVRLLHSLPQVKVPHSFALTPRLVPKTARSWQYPLLQLGTALATLAFLLVTGVGLLMRIGMAAAPAMSVAREVGQGMAAAPAEPSMTEAPAQAPAAGGTAGAESAAPPVSNFVGGAPSAPEATPFSLMGTPAPACAECPLAAPTQTPSLPLEERAVPTELPAPERTACAECEMLGTAGPGFFADQALKANPATESPPVETAAGQRAEAPMRPPVSLWTVLQIVLGLSAILLGVLTFRMRRRIR